MILKLILFGVFGCVTSQMLFVEEIPEESYKSSSVSKAREDDYEIVPIDTSRMQERRFNNGIHLKVNAFGKNIKMWLNPIDGKLATSQTPIYSVTKGHQLTKNRGAMKRIVGKLYYNRRYLTSMSLNRHSYGKVDLHGVIGSENLLIEPVPDNYVNRYKRFIDDIPDSEFSNYTYHIVHKLPEAPEYMKTFKAPMITLPRSKRLVASGIIYPQVLVIVDYALFKKMRKSLISTVGYVLAFWNGVDLRYRSLEKPSFRFSIAAVIIATEPDSLEYMLYHSNDEPHDLLVHTALDKSIPWLKKLENLIWNEEFDFAITISAENFCQKERNKCVRGTVGLAYVQGACDRDFKSGMVHDEGGFKGIDIAAHEIGHLLGAIHDGEDHIKCPSKDGYLMDPKTSYSPRGSDWSKCSVEDMENFLNMRDSKCLFNKPKRGYAVPRFLPGKLMDANEQCKKRLGTKASIINASTCIILRCDVPNNPSMMRLTTAPADGTKCGRGKICLNRKCILESKIKQ